MITNAQPWDNLKFDEEGVKDVTRKFFGTLHNTYKFFAQYANVDGFDNSAAQIPVAERPVMDRWILSELNSLTKDVRDSLDDYEPTRAGRLITNFVNDYLSNWYVHLTRDRYWGSSMSADKLAAYQTLYTCLETVARLMSPIAPFYADRLFRDLTAVCTDAPVSVHLAEYPKCNDALVDKELETRMELAQKLTSMVLALRKRDDVKINVRKPLQKILIPVTEELKKHLEPVKELIRNEVNVGDYSDRDEMGEQLYDTLFCEDSITGNASGSYTFNSYKAKEYIESDPEAYTSIRELVSEYGIEAETVADKFLNEDWEYWDVSIRCYLLYQAVDKALEELEDSGELADYFEDEEEDEDEEEE
jgi:isoleucyl-tRNA synthetase